MADEFNELTRYLDEIMPPKEQPLKDKVKDAIDLSLKETSGHLIN